MYAKLFSKLYTYSNRLVKNVSSATHNTLKTKMKKPGDMLNARKEKRNS